MVNVTLGTKILDVTLPKISKKGWISYYGKQKSEIQKKPEFEKS